MSERKRKKEYLGPDRLSSLPEALVIHILSFLNTKHAVQASLSLKKWVHLWTLIPDLNFDCSVFRKFSSFDLFVDKVLTLRDDSIKINKFFLNPKQMAILKFEFFKTAEYAVSHDVQHLTMSHCYSDRMSKDRLGSSSSLRSLKLLGSSFYNSLCLEQLVTLHLVRVNLYEPGNFSNYPNLKNLTLKDCGTDNGCNFVSLSIVAPQLSRLVIVRCFRALGAEKTNELMLSTPRLSFFKIVEYTLPLLQTDELTSLNTVDMSAFSSQQQVSQLISMLKSFPNVNYVRLFWFLIQLLSRFPNELASEPSPFCNLKSLNIVASNWRKTNSVTLPGHVTTYLLGKSPNANTVIEIKMPSCKRCVKESYYY